MRAQPGLVWTAEDSAIFRRFLRFQTFGALVLWSLYQDRRDAELMLGAQVKPLVHWRSGLGDLILLRGATYRTQGLRCLH